MKTIWLASLVLALSACVSDPTEKAPKAVDAASLWRVSDHEDDIRVASCPEGQSYVSGTPIDLKVEPVSLMPEGRTASLPEGVTFVAGFSLSSSDARFGGLSGIEATRGGNLIAVSDLGSFVFIVLDDDGVTPFTSARLSSMYGADGNLLTGKSQTDAEGLTLSADDTTAFVSFERDHRVLAFYLEDCGSIARGVPVASWGSRPTGLSKDVGENGGAEALALGSGGELLVGLETNDGNSPFGPVTADGTPDLTGRVDTPGLLSLTGADRLGDRLYTVHRFYAPGVGNRIAVQEHIIDGADATLTRQLAYIEPPMTVDNFEGITARDMGDGITRIYLISDDNFSSNQRTLLFVFDVRD